MYKSEIFGEKDATFKNKNLYNTHVKEKLMLLYNQIKELNKENWKIYLKLRNTNR